MAGRRRRNDSDEDLNFTKDDLENFKKAVKDEKFRDLLRDYADEVTNPENVAQYQKDITQLEKERGVDITFLQPKPIYVIKTSANGEKKAFINICTNENVAKPKCEQSNNADGQRGLQWAIPYSLAPERDDMDKQNRYCLVYDALFHPDTILLAKNNKRFKKLVEDTALDGVEKSFNVKLDRKNLKYPRMKFKGLPVAAVIRKRSDKPPEVLKEDLYLPPQSKYDRILEKGEDPFVLKAEDVTPVKKEDDGINYTKPKFVIKHVKEVELGDYAYQLNGAPTVDNRPKQLGIEIDLPLISSAAALDLDVTERKLKLESKKPAAYLLELQFSYPVDCDAANAKFDSSKKRLFVTCPVKMKKQAQINVINKDDAIESADVTKSNTVVDNTAESNIKNDVTIDQNGSESIFKQKKSDKEDGKSLIEELDERTSNLDDSDDDIVDNVIDPRKDPEIYRLFPSYDVKQTETELIFKLIAFNVDPDSVVIKKEKDEKCFNDVCLQFTSMGAGFVPCYYSFYLKSEEEKFEGDVKVDVGDGNVIFRLCKQEIRDWCKVLLGVDEDNVEVVNLITLPDLVEQLEKMQVEIDKEKIRKSEVASVVVDEMNENCLEFSVQTSINEAVSENYVEDKDESIKQDKSKEKMKSLPPRRKTRSFSDSSDILNPDHQPRSILKTYRMSRSLSESSEDAIGISFEELKKPLGSISSEEKIPEESSADEESGIRKSVRFNDVVSKNLYRSSSSILGQRKKNQRKQQLKKRANQKRTSESEGSENENDIHAKGERKRKDSENGENINGNSENGNSENENSGNGNLENGNSENGNLENGNSENENPENGNSETENGKSEESGEETFLNVDDLHPNETEQFIEVVRKGKKKRNGKLTHPKDSDGKLIEEITVENKGNENTKNESLNENELNDKNIKTKENNAQSILSWTEEEGGIIRVDKVDLGFTNTAIFDLD